MTLLLASLLSGVAFAHNEIEIPIPSTAPPTNITGDAETVVFGRVIRGEAVGEDDVLIKVSESPISCEIKDGDIYVSVTLNTASWPTTVPASGTCTVGTDSVTVVPVFDTDFTTWITGTDQASPATTLSVVRPTGQAGQKMYKLATSGYAYEAKTSQAVLDDSSTWSGVVCYTLDTSEGWMLGLQIGTTAVAGEGSCLIGKDGVGNYTLDLSLANPL